MRRPVALLVVLILALVVPASVFAARATRLTDHSVNLSCDGISTTAGTGFAFFGAFSSDVSGSDAYLDAWAADEPTGQPDLSRDYSLPADVSWDGTTMSGAFPLVDPTGITVGSASFTATLTPVGDPYPIDDSFHEGNRKERVTGTGQAMQPTGSLVLTTGATFDLDVCTGDMSTISVFSTNPASAVNHFSARSVSCQLTNTAGDAASLFVGLEDPEAFIDANVFPADAAPDLYANGVSPIVGGVVDTSLDTYLNDTGEPAGVASSIHMTLTATDETFEVVMRDGQEKRISRGTLIDIEGTLSVGSYTFDLSPCVGADYRTKDFFSPKRGPKPGGKVPSNDLPGGAKLLAIGASTNVQTKGAAPDREAPYDCLTFEDQPGVIVEVPVANTVWYKVVGTGGSITIDTAGSDFDTVVAVYTSAGGAYVPVPKACVDDVPTVPFGRSLQAAVTFPTTTGATYYVQIGGFPSDFPYGNLRVKVR